MPRCMSLRHQALHHTYLFVLGTDTGKFDATKDAKKETTKPNTILESRCVSVKQKYLSETQNYGVGREEYSRMCGKETKHSRLVVEGGGKDMIQAFGGNDRR